MSGIDISPTTALQYVVTNTVIQGSDFGLSVNPAPQSSGVSGAVSRLTVSGANLGVFISATAMATNTQTYATITDSVLSSNVTGLVAATLANRARATVVIQHSTIANNTSSGIHHFVNGVGQTIPTSIRIGNTTIANNPKGIRFEHSATVSSLGNNMFTDNGVDLDGGTLVALAPK